MKIWRMFESMHNKPYKCELLTDGQLQSLEETSAPVLRSIASIKSNTKGAGTIGAFVHFREAKAPEEEVRLLWGDEVTTLKGGTLYPSLDLEFYVIRGDYVKSGELLRVFDLREVMRIYKSNGADAVRAHILGHLQEALSWSVTELQTRQKTYTGARKGLS